MGNLYTLDIDASQIVAEKCDAHYTYKGERGYMLNLPKIARVGILWFTLLSSIKMRFPRQQALKSDSPDLPYQGTRNGTQERGKIQSTRCSGN